MTVVLKRKYEVTRKTMFGEEVVHSEFTTETCDVCGDTGYVHVHYYEFGDGSVPSEASERDVSDAEGADNGEERALCQSCDQGEE